MDVVLLASNRPGVGKTALAAALLYRWSQQGYRFAYVRIGSDGGSQESDTGYLGGMDAPPLTVPRINPDIDPIREVSTALSGFAAEVSSLGCRLVVEVSPPTGEDSRAWTLCGELAEAVNGSVVAMVDYEAALEIDRLNAELRPVSQRICGLLVNAAPPYRVREGLSYIRANGEHGCGPLLGVVPEDRTMLAPTVAQLASNLNAQWVLGEEKSDSLVCRVLIGGNLMDPGVTYFGRYSDQGVVVRGDRPDIQLAALGSDLCCLVLTGGHQPIPYVFHEAQEQEVPLLVTSTNTHATAELAGGLIAWGTVHHQRKAERYARLMEEHCDPGLLQGLLA